MLYPDVPGALPPDGPRRPATVRGDERVVESEGRGAATGREEVNAVVERMGRVIENLQVGWGVFVGGGIRGVGSF